MKDLAKTTDASFVKSIAALAMLDLPESRADDLVNAALPVHELLKKLVESDLAETAPATAFNAAWE